MNQLDQFYTKPQVASTCYRHTRNIVDKLAGRGLFFIEPSAGDGVFYDLLPQRKRIGFDIEPHHPGIKRTDFLRTRYQPPVSADKAIVIGNPPFGKRGKTAVAFVNKAFEMADTVAFIVPIIFAKYFIHKQIDQDARLISRKPLRRHAFRTLTHDSYEVNAEFQIWTRLPSKHRNKRLFQPPPIAHPDFTMWQYNNTQQARKMFDQPFDFAVPCQGYQDYSRRETDSSKCERHKQWMLLKPRTESARAILRDTIDYATLAKRNTTTTPGFRKGDLVAEYQATHQRLYG